MRIQLTPAAISALGVLLLGGCPTPAEDASFGKVAPPTNIPAGTYRGNVNFTMESRVNGEAVQSQSDTFEDSVIIDADGRIFNTTSGQAAKVGDADSSVLADRRFTTTITSITSSGNTITANYDVVWIDGDDTFTGEGADQYIYTGSAIECQSSIAFGTRISRVGSQFGTGPHEVPGETRGDVDSSERRARRS